MEDDDDPGREAYRRLRPLEAADGREGLGRPDLAEGLWRRRAERGGSAGAGPGDGRLGSRQSDRRHGDQHVRSHASRIRHGGPEATPYPADHPRRVALVPGLLGAGGGIGSRLAADQARGRRRPLGGQRPEDLDLRRPVGGLVLLPGANGYIEEARGHQLRPHQHAPTGRRDPSDQADRRQFAVLRDLLHQCYRVEKNDMVGPWNGALRRWASACCSTSALRPGRPGRGDGRLARRAGCRISRRPTGATPRARTTSVREWFPT